MPSDDRNTTPRPVAIILAGGAASRMGGTDKTRLPVGRSSSLERVLRAVPGGQPIVVGPATDDGAELSKRHGARFVLEQPPRSGPVAALARGVEELTAAPGETRVLVLAGDMPLLRRDTLTGLSAAAPSGTEVVALSDGADHIQFLCAAWSLTRLRTALAAIENPEGGWANLSLRRLYAELGEGELVTRPAVGSESRDLDTPDDLDELRRAAGARVALAQIVASEDVAQNVESTRRAVAAAAAEGADLVLLPEATLTPFGTDLRAAAEQHHPAFDELITSLAAAHGITVAAGTFTPTDDGRVHNTVIIRGPGHGPAVTHADYRKIHLFDAFGTRESDTVAPGEELVTIDLDGTRLGIATCYDVRFPAQFTQLARRGAHAVLLPLAWGDGPGKSEQLRVLLRARALDSTTIVLAADQAPPPGYQGRAPRGIGQSAVIGPLGQVREELGREEGMIVVDLDLTEVAAAREALPVLEHGAAIDPQ